MRAIYLFLVIQLLIRFLLGKFVADRQYHIKYFRDTDLHMLKELIVARNTLDATVGDIVKHSNTSEHTELNTEIYSHFTYCMKDSLEFNTRADIFVGGYISHKISQQAICFVKLNEFLKTIDDKLQQQQNLP